VKEHPTERNERPSEAHATASLTRIAAAAEPHLVGRWGQSSAVGRGRHLAVGWGAIPLSIPLSVGAPAPTEPCLV
jgi:hypothetical protein